jgi:hypothetical protein
MLGGVFATSGIAPGFRASLTAWKLERYVVDFAMVRQLPHT